MKREVIPEQRSMSREIAKWTLRSIGALIMLALVAFMIQGTDFFLYKTFAPRQEAARREVFEQSKAYRDGLMQELRAAQIDYAKASSPQQKLAIGSLVLHDAAGFKDELPPDLDAFVRTVRAEQIGGAQ
jgi:hypothetical protein